MISLHPRAAGRMIERIVAPPSFGKVLNYCWICMNPGEYASLSHRRKGVVFIFARRLNQERLPLIIDLIKGLEYFQRTLTFHRYAGRQAIDHSYGAGERIEIGG